MLAPWRHTANRLSWEAQITTWLISSLCLNPCSQPSPSPLLQMTPSHSSLPPPPRSCPFQHFRPEKLVWHGSSTVGIRLTSNYCEAWRTGDMAVTGQAAMLQTGRLLGQHPYSCSNHYIVLCIENTYVGNTHQRRT
ncbi:hypothetical protein GOODEAATRI_005351 [Goodea atripinnis]|uniref:Collagenase NC10/endostatin domain-containing protein n=1 Tax=Goodea atripinnis TaxID=208336 RepID=A0ABV0MI38_9TELE